MITLKLGNGTPIEGDTVEVEGRCVTLRNKKPARVLIFAYCLREGEQLRKTGDNEYEINL